MNPASDHSMCKVLDEISFLPLHRHDEHCVYELFQLFYLGLKNATAMQNSREHRYLNDNV